MNMSLALLIVTMSVNSPWTEQQFGEVSVTLLPSIEACEQAKKEVSEQIKRTDFLEFDDNEIIVSCKIVKG